MTVKQRQALLFYLGYYVGVIDGVWGQLSKVACSAFRKDFGLAASTSCDAETEKALKHAVAYGMPAKPEKPAADGDFWNEIKYFKRSEFKCKCGGKHCNGYPAEPKKLLVRLAERARAHFNSPATVISGLRCAVHNEACGGVSDSQHMYGEAVDIQIKGVSADSLLAYIKQQPEVRYAYKINSTNVHFDIPKGAR